MSPWVWLACQLVWLDMVVRAKMIVSSRHGLLLVGEGAFVVSLLIVIGGPVCWLGSIGWVEQG